MSILSRARGHLPQEYLANGGAVQRQTGGILPRYNRTPTTHPTGYEYDTIGYNQRPWDIGQFVTSPLGDTGTTTSPGFYAPISDVTDEPTTTTKDYDWDGSTTTSTTNPYLTDNAANIDLAIQPDQALWEDVPTNIQNAAEVLAVDPSNPNYNDRFNDVFDYWSDDADKNPTGQTTGYGTTPGILDETGIDAWLPPTGTTSTATETATETASNNAANLGSDEAIITTNTSALINEREGFSDTAYEDPPGSGKWSIGNGTQTYADGTPVKAGDTITEAEATNLTNHHIGIATDAAKNNVENFDELSPELQTALVSHAYQLGAAGQAEFKKMIAAIEAGDYDTAIAEAEDSLWATQTPKRLADLKAALEAEGAKVAPVVIEDNNKGWQEAHNARHDAAVKAAAAKAVSEGKAPVGSAGGPSPHDNQGGIVRKANQGGIISKSNGGAISHPTYRGILMNKLNRRNR